MKLKWDSIWWQMEHEPRLWVYKGKITVIPGRMVIIITKEYEKIKAKKFHI